MAKKKENRYFEIEKLEPISAFIYDYDVHVIKIISRQDLTIEWLDNSGNCELKRCTACEDLNCKNQKCDLWT